MDNERIKWQHELIWNKCNISHSASKKTSLCRLYLALNGSLILREKIVKLSFKLKKENQEKTVALDCTH